LGKNAAMLRILDQDSGQNDSSAAKAKWHNERFYVSRLKWYFSVLRFVGIWDDYLHLLESQSHCSQFTPIFQGQSMIIIQNRHSPPPPTLLFGGRCFRRFDNTLKNAQGSNNNLLDNTFTKVGRPKFVHSNVSFAVTNSLSCQTQINRENL
jgi:hypothetical protein